MEALLILFVVVRMLTNAAEDVSNAAKGRPRRPRLTDRINNWKPNGQKGPKGRYGARRYVADLWQDSWTDARTSRDAKRAKRAADKAAAAQPDPAPVAAPGPQPAPKPSPRPQPTPDPAGEQPKLRLVPDPAQPQSPSTPDPATPPAGDNPTPAQPAGKEDPMSSTVSSGEITSIAAARSFADAMLGHNKQIMTEIEAARASLASRGISGPVINELNSLREYYAQAGGRWEGLQKAIAQHERLAEQVRATKGAAKDTSFYTNA